MPWALCRAGNAILCSRTIGGFYIFISFLFEQKRDELLKVSNCTLILNLNVKKDSHEINQSKFSVFLLVGRGGEDNLLSKSC